MPLSKVELNFSTRPSVWGMGVSRGHLAIIAILRNDIGGRGSALATGLCMHGNHYEYSPYCGMQTE